METEGAVPGGSTNDDRQRRKSQPRTRAGCSGAQLVVGARVLPVGGIGLAGADGLATRVTPLYDDDATTPAVLDVVTALG